MDSHEDRVVDHAVRQIESYLTNVETADDRILRDKQVEVMSDLHEFLKTHLDEPHGYISLPTGVGKTVLFTELVKATDLRTLILMPTQGLLDQTERAFQRFGNKIDVGKVYAKEQNSNERITLSTYASFVRHTKKGSDHIAPGLFDLIVLDEAHRALGEETKRALINYDSAIQIGFTATEDYSEERRLQSLLPTEIHKMTIREAIEHELITPFVNVLVKTGVDISDVRITNSNEYDTSDLEKALNTGSRNMVALDLYQKYFNGQKTMIFCNGVEHAKDVAEMFRRAGITAKALDGKLSLEEQVTAKEAFANTGPGSIDVLTNDKLLAEGFDVPAVTVCFNLSPTLSRVRAQQRGGRTLRLDPNNPEKIAYVVDFIDEDYQKPPVLFADPHVAEQAQVGVTSESIKTFKNDDSETSIITNPSTIKHLAHDFHEQRQAKREYAPDGWLSVGQISALYNLRGAAINNALSGIDKTDQSLAKQCHSRYTTHKTKRTYYNPSLVEDLVKSYNLDYIDFDDRFPRGWTTNDSFATDYPPKVFRSMRRYVRRVSAGFLTDESVVFGDVEYISPRLQRLLHKASQPQPHWLPAKDLADKYHIDESGIEEFANKIARKERNLSGTYPLWCLQEGREEMYLFPMAYDYLDKELGRVAHEPQLMKEGEIISLREEKRKHSKAAELIRLFEFDNNVYDMVKQKNLDALYAEFSHGK